MPKHTVSSEWEMCCPSCKQDTDIDIAATVWVRLTPDGTDASASYDGSHEWGSNDGAVCRGCGFSGNVDEFKITGVEEVEEVTE